MKSNNKLVGLIINRMGRIYRIIEKFFHPYNHVKLKPDIEKHNV